MKLSRRVSIITIICLCMSLLAGCTKKMEEVQETDQQEKIHVEEKEDSKTEDQGKDTAKEDKSAEPKFENDVLNIAVFQGGYGREFWDNVTKMFEEAYDVKVNVEANPKIGELIRPKMLSGDSPDFIYLNEADSSGLTRALIKDKGIMDITEVFEGLALDQEVPLKTLINDGFLETKKMSPYGDGRVYLAPFNYTLTGLWYNKNLFDARGWEAPETWDELFSYQEKAEAEDRALFTYQGIYPGYLETVIHTSIASAGGMEAANAVFNHEEGAWISESTKKIAAVLQKMADDKSLLKGTVAMNHTQSQTEFMLGNALFCPNGTWFESEMKDAPREEGFEFGFMGAPVFNKGDQMYVAAGIEQMYIPKASKNPELAKEFLRFLYTEKSVIENAKISKGVMAVKGTVDKVKDLIPVSSYNAYSIFDRTDAKPLVLNLAPMPETITFSYGDYLYNPISDIMNGDLTGEQWRANLEEINKEIRAARNE